MGLFLLLQSEDILHIIEPGFTALEPKRSTNCTRGKGHSGRGFVCEFKAFSIGRKHHGVVADDVATTLKATVVTRMKFDAATRQPTFTATKFVIRGKNKI